MMVFTTPLSVECGLLYYRHILPLCDIVAEMYWTSKCTHVGYTYTCVSNYHLKV